MRELGWIEGKKIIVEQRHAEKAAESPVLAKELVEGNANVMLTDSPAATRQR